MWLWETVFLGETEEVLELILLELSGVLNKIIITWWLSGVETEEDGEETTEEEEEEGEEKESISKSRAEETSALLWERGGVCE